MGIFGVELVCDKEGIKRIFKDVGILVFCGKVICYFDEFEDVIEDVGGYFIVIKFLDGNYGCGIIIDVRNW